jgi:hypothetical protein
MKYYEGSILSFTRSEKQLFVWYSELVLPYLEKFAPKLVPLLHSVHLIKTMAGTEWDYPFTLESCIVFSENFIKKAKEGRDTDNDAIVKNVMCVIVHELVHIYQKANPRAFDSSYSKMGFSRLRVTLSSKVRNMLITNPDAHEEKGSVFWVTTVNSKRTGTVHVFLPALTTNKEAVLIELKRVSDSNEFVSSSNIININDVPAYKNRFGTSSQLDHPNEISANIISEYIIYGRNASSWVYKSQTLDLIKKLN